MLRDAKLVGKLDSWQQYTGRRWDLDVRFFMYVQFVEYCYDNLNYSNHDNYYKFENYYYVDNDENNGKHNNIQNIKIITKILFKRNSNHNLFKKIIILKIKISDEIILISLK